MGVIRDITNCDVELPVKYGTSGLYNDAHNTLFCQYLEYSKWIIHIHKRILIKEVWMRNKFFCSNSTFLHKLLQFIQFILFPKMCGGKHTLFLVWKYRSVKIKWEPVTAKAPKVCYVFLMCYQQLARAHLKLMFLVWAAALWCDLFHLPADFISCESQTILAVSLTLSLGVIIVHKLISKCLISEGRPVVVIATARLNHNERNVMFGFVHSAPVAFSCICFLVS